MAPIIPANVRRKGSRIRRPLRQKRVNIFSALPAVKGGGVCFFFGRQKRKEKCLLLVDYDRQRDTKEKPSARRSGPKNAGVSVLSYGDAGKETKRGIPGTKKKERFLALRRRCISRNPLLVPAEVPYHLHPVGGKKERRSKELAFSSWDTFFIG